MRVLVCGGRRYDNALLVFRELDALYDRPPRVAFLINGQAPGADRFASSWARSRGVPLAEFPAFWNLFGAGAGPIRNEWMLKFGAPDLVLAFPGGRGTANMVEQARAAGVEVRQIAC